MLLVATSVTYAQKQKAGLGDNAALRYWSAFAEMQDAAITDEQVRALRSIFDGTAPYDDQKFKDLVDKNARALETMARGTALSNCDWGLEYQIGPDFPMDYPVKAVALARLNVLYGFHLLSKGDKDKRHPRWLLDCDSRGILETGESCSLYFSQKILSSIILGLLHLRCARPILPLNSEGCCQKPLRNSARSRSIGNLQSGEKWDFMASCLGPQLARHSNALFVSIKERSKTRPCCRSFSR
jgi:hypothetical protein